PSLFSFFTDRLLLCHRQRPESAPNPELRNPRLRRGISELGHQPVGFEKDLRGKPYEPSGIRRGAVERIQAARGDDHQVGKGSWRQNLYRMLRGIRILDPG